MVMTWADSSVRGVGRQAGGEGGGIRCREEVRTGNSLLIKHYSTVINILPVEIRPQTQWVQARKHHRLFHSALPLLPLHSAALTCIITLSGFPQTKCAATFFWLTNQSHIITLLSGFRQDRDTTAM